MIWRCFASRPGRRDPRRLILDFTAIQGGSSPTTPRLILAAMGPEFMRDDHMMRVDGDVLEVFDVQYHARRIPLVWLAVRAEALRKNKVLIYIGQNNVDQLLYAPGKQVPDVRGDVLGIGIDAEEEPAYRAFFSEVARLCGRRVAEIPDS